MQDQYQSLQNQINNIGFKSPVIIKDGGEQ